MIWVEFTKWPTFVQTPNRHFFSLSERSPTYIQAVSYVLATTKRSWSGGSTREDMTLMHCEYAISCIVIITDETLWLTVFSSWFGLQNRHLHSHAGVHLLVMMGKWYSEGLLSESGGGEIQRRFGKRWRGYLIYWQCTCLRWTFPGQDSLRYVEKCSIRVIVSPRYRIWSY